MVVIKALIWKRCIEIKNSKRLWLFLLAPIFCFFVFLFFDISQYKMFLTFCPIAAYISFFASWNFENIVYSGYMLVTPMNSKKNWINNALITTVSGYAYSYLILIIGTLLKSIFINNFYLEPKLFLLGLLNLPFAFSLILSSTICNVDYSPIKQIIQIPFVVVGIGFIIMTFFFNSMFFDIDILPIILALIITTICLLINIKNDNECLFNNTLKVIYELGEVIDD